MKKQPRINSAHGGHLLGAFRHKLLRRLFDLLNKAYTDQLDPDELQTVAGLRARLLLKPPQPYGRSTRRLFWNIIHDPAWIRNVDGQMARVAA